MQNAKQHHVDQAQPLGGRRYPLNVVFLVAANNNEEKIKAHIKRSVFDLSSKRFILLMEDMEGGQFLAKHEYLSPIPRKQGTPAKAKRKPHKGTKPWLANSVPYDPALIKVGTRVLCRNGETRTVTNVTMYHVDFGDYKSVVYVNTGKALWAPEEKHDFDIIKIIVEGPKAAPEVSAPVKKNNVVPNWIFWEGKTKECPVNINDKVEVWFRDSDNSCNHIVGRAGIWCWLWNNQSSDIIAYRIVD